jgi:hypothetical protein
LPVIAQAGQNLTLCQVQLLKPAPWSRNTFGSD